MHLQSYVSGPCTHSLLGETIGQNLDRMIEAFPEREALVVPFQGVRHTYRTFGREVDRVARGLLAIGVARGDRVGIWSPNNAEWARVQCASAG